MEVEEVKLVDDLEQEEVCDLDLDEASPLVPRPTPSPCRERHLPLCPDCPGWPASLATVAPAT